MATIRPDCPSCRERMTAGYVLESAGHGKLRLAWLEGAPEKNFLGSWQTKDRAQHDLVAYRCPRCAWVIWFAPQSDENEK